MSGEEKFRSTVDKSLADICHVQGKGLKTSATLKDRAVINMAAWKGGVFGTSIRG
jgi:hypothetical protein